MSRSCDICEKTSLKGRKITKAWGVKYKTIRHRKPNLRKVSVKVNNLPVQLKICAKCLRSIKNDKIKLIQPINNNYKKTKQNIEKDNKQ